MWDTDNLKINDSVKESLISNLEELADQLDVLAELVKNQDIYDRQEPIRRFSVIAKRFNDLETTSC